MRWILLLTLVGCAMPMKESLRPRGIDVYSQTGQSRYYGNTQHDWAAGVNVHWDLHYEDEQ